MDYWSELCNVSIHNNDLHSEALKAVKSSRWPEKESLRSLRFKNELMISRHSKIEIEDRKLKSKYLKFQKTSQNIQKPSEFFHVTLLTDPPETTFHWNKLSSLSTTLRIRDLFARKLNSRWNNINYDNFFFSNARSSRVLTYKLLRWMGNGSKSRSHMQQQ